LNSFRTRLTLIIISIIALAVSAAGFMMMNTFKNIYIDALEDNMVREMKLIASRMDWKSTDKDEELFQYYTDQAKELKSYTESRITFIRSDGVVLGDSDYAAQEMNNHLYRTEVTEALEQGIGRSVRSSNTMRMNMIYVAIPIQKDNSDSYKYVIRMAMTLEEVDNGLRKVMYVMIGGLLVLFVLAAVISYRVALGLTKPLEQITKVAKRITNQDYVARVTVAKKDEIGELGNAINAMADSLQVQMERIKQNESQLQSVLAHMINGIVMIESDGRVVLMNRHAEEVLGLPSSELVGRHYSEAKQQYELSQMIQGALRSKEALREEVTFYYPEERLVELTLVPISDGEHERGGVLLVLQDVSAIRRLERMRSEFVANVSHELKTPIAAVKGFAETLLGGAVKDEETARSFLQIIFDESDRLNRLIGDILELSKIESRRVPLMFSPVELDSFVSKTMTLLESEASLKGIELCSKIQPGLYVEADEDRLRQIVMNLLANGINYTPDGGKVTLSIHSINDDLLSIQISDTGIGIPKKDLPRIFERFYRVDKARSRSSGGTGLGLSIVKHLVELHKGTITVTSTTGVGTTFTIILPVLQ